jgi:hypothetical protein
MLGESGEWDGDFAPMLTATDRREVRGRDGDVSRLGAQIPRSVFRAAYRELCARIWIELELLAQASAQIESRPAQDLVMSAAILRLELVVLVDWCRSPRWRSSILSAEQCDNLCSMLTDVLAALCVDANDLRGGIAAAQDKVLDRLLSVSDDGPSFGEPASAHEFAPGYENTVNELIDVIKAQAGSRAIQ